MHVGNRALDSLETHFLFRNHNQINEDRQIITIYSKTNFYCIDFYDIGPMALSSRILCLDVAANSHI